ncbi:MAG TPA: transposase, partial [Acidimicrobiales bacterium]|nr:transposase [Acidimicrobiales bacterium]
QAWSTSIVDVRRGRLLDVVEGRTAAEPCRWLAQRGQDRLDAIEFATLDLSGSYRKVFDTMVPAAVQVADPLTWSSWRTRSWTSAGAGSRTRPWATGATSTIRSTGPGC